MRLLLVGIVAILVCLGVGYWWYSSQILYKEPIQVADEVTPQLLQADAVARLDKVEGQARFYKSKTDEVGEVAAGGGVLRAGQILKTGSLGSVKLSLAGPTIVELNSLSAVSLNTPSDYTFMYGSSNWTVGSSQVSVVTDAGTLSAQDSSFTISSDQSQVQIKVDKGSVTLLDRNNQAIIIPAGQTQDISQ